MKKSIGAVTINDVAAAAKVSTATVSRALNRPENVSASLREKINNVIKKLGYIPNAGARALMLKRSGTIGAIVPTLDNAIFARGLAEFQKQLNQAGYQLLVASTNYDPAIESNQINNLLARGVEGVALFGASQEKDALSLLKTRSIPYIHVGSLTAPLNGFASGIDNREAIKLSVQHLLDLGHKYFGILTGITVDNDRAKDRVAGALELLAQKKIYLEREVIVECHYALQEAKLGLKKLLLSNPKITAIICGQDVLALGAILEAQNQGIKIPEELSIVGFDDLEISRHILPSLTTIHIDAVSMWAQAANHLISQINGVENLPKKIKVSVNLVIRDSSSHAPKNNRGKAKEKTTPKGGLKKYYGGNT